MRLTRSVNRDGAASQPSRHIEQFVETGMQQGPRCSKVIVAHGVHCKFRAPSCRSTESCPFPDVRKRWTRSVYYLRQVNDAFGSIVAVYPYAQGNGLAQLQCVNEMGLKRALTISGRAFQYRGVERAHLGVLCRQWEGGERANERTVVSLYWDGHVVLWYWHSDRRQCMVMIRWRPQ